MKQTYYPKTNNYLKQCRLAKGISQVEVGQKLGYSSQFVANWERHVSFIPFDRLKEYLDFISANKKEFLNHYLSDEAAYIKGVLK